LFILFNNSFIDVCKINLFEGTLTYLKNANLLFIIYLINKYFQKI